MGVSDISGKVKSSIPALPQIYAYTTPEVPKHDGWTKIGYTEQDVHERIRQQSHTVDVYCKLEWNGNALYEGGSETFTDHDLHAYLIKLGYNRNPNTEWFEVEPPEARVRFYEFRENHGVIETPEPSEYVLREEQREAVRQTADYFRLHEAGEFLWNAKPRFGKTLTTYDLVKMMGAQRVLIVTNRPAIANSWYDDYEKFVGTQGGYSFVSEVDALKGRPHCLSREGYTDAVVHGRAPKALIEFVSLQDLKGAIAFGGKYDKLNEVADLEWDVLVIDEAHEGVDTLKTDVAFDHIRRKFTLHLSGTPFKAIANEKFPQDAIYNWTYADEQRAKRDWADPEMPNPYASLPQLNMFTYQMSEIVADEVSHGIDLDGETAEYAFDLNEFFSTRPGPHGVPRFVYDSDVDRFLDALTEQRKFPFSTRELRDELRHTFWMLDRVDSARALAKKLQKHPVFGDYEVVLAAGDGRIDDADESEKALDRVRKAIAEHDYTITLSVGQLTTGITVPEWTAVLMLSNMKSPSLYMQAAFRAQNPCLFEREGRFLRKRNAYVFDFDPARTLTIFEEFANDLYSDTAAGGGDLDARKQRVRTLLNFFPVIGEDEHGEMVELDAEKVLSIPRKIRSTEVVRRGFMSDFLFQNISNVFRAPAEVIEIIKSFEPTKAPVDDLSRASEAADELDLNEDGEVEIPDSIIVGKAAELFGDKVYGVEYEFEKAIEQIASASEPTEEDALIDRIAIEFHSQMTAPLVETAKERYGADLRAGQQSKIERKITADVGIAVNRAVGDYKIERNRIELERGRQLEGALTEAERAEVNELHDARLERARESFVNGLKASRDEFVHGAGETIVREVETAKREAKKQSIEGDIRDHLRGFSRTIPSFLMAYGDEGTRLANFDQIIPAEVFEEVTSITVEQFRFLRDGGDFMNEESGVVEHFDGHLFDPVVFDDSVREFINLRSRLANYFDESLDEDIFDYVPPQKTNQIFTPRSVVREMLDLFEAENPGCFDDPGHTFADLYMKSGLYITEVVKRLFNSEGMRAAIPSDAERLRHIFENQVFGIAPTEIIYQIATHFILGYDGEIGGGCDANFVVADSAELAKEGRLAEFVEETFGDKLG